MKNIWEKYSSMPRMKNKGYLRKMIGARKKESLEKDLCLCVFCSKKKQEEIEPKILVVKINEISLKEGEKVEILQTFDKVLLESRAPMELGIQEQKEQDKMKKIEKKEMKKEKKEERKEERKEKKK